MSHLTRDELVDLAEGILPSARRAHVESCAACREQGEALTALLGDARAVVVDEPSPLFWEHLSERVRQSIAEEPVAAPAWPRWLQWPVLVPVAGLALLVLALATAVPQPSSVESIVAENHPDRAATADPDAEVAVDSAFAFILESVGPLDLDTAQEAGIAAGPGSADRAALHLTDEEQDELVRLLQVELARGSSGG
jgi:hypothetical protein